MLSSDLAGEQGSMKSWIPRKHQRLEQMTITSMVHTLSQAHLRTAEEIVPWYLRNLPAAYFREVGEETRNEHLKGLTAVKGINQDMSLTLKSHTETGDADVTVMRTCAKPGTLLEMLESMPANFGPDGGVLCRVKVFSSFDGGLALNIFTYGNRTQSRPRATPEDGKAVLEAADPTHRESLTQYLSLCEPSYVQHAHPDCFDSQRQLYEKVKGTDGAEAALSFHTRSSGDVEGVWAMLAVANVMSRTMLTKVAALLFARGMNVEQMYLDLVQDPANSLGEWVGTVAMIRALVKPASQQDLPEGMQRFPGSMSDLTSAPWHELVSDLRRIKWLDTTAVNLAIREVPSYGMQRAEILTAFCAMLHGPLNKVNAYMFSRPSLLALVKHPRSVRYFTSITDLFIARFNPANPMPSDEFQRQVEELKERVQALQDEASRTLMLKMIDAVVLTKRTNLFCPSRYALALRVDPSLMVGPGKEMPFGVIFVHGDHFDGFHNRFQNIARGGLRIVSPGSAEQHAIESSRCYDEVYGLSFAQQLKNKDIPEGGSKAVVLVDTSRCASSVRQLIMRQAVKAFTDAALDLIVPVQETRKWIVDQLGFEELLYLGPDEQVISEDINWIIKRAGQRGYPIPAAFMSSKPAAGINHKQYGVTSEGVVVFLDVALRNAGINPDEQPFTVKITGGPDGDVAGNLMRILFRNYGERARVVGVADGSGCAEDPNGLPQSELLRLFEKALPIAELDATQLSAEGAVHRVESEEGMRKRNSMHNRVKADVFVPAGGRPSTIHANNWKEFLVPGVEGEASSPLIVEGANIFITPEARRKLHDHAKVQIVKDSSANKCGVITSSYEICASMLLDEDEFLGIKDELVRDVLEKLRELARLEAELLFRECKNYPGSLPEFSERISKAINRTTVAIEASLKGMERGDSTYNQLMPLFLEHLPKKLTEVAADRVHSRIPLDYLRNAFASCMASKLLYREGINFLELQPEEKLAELAVKYVAEEKRLNRLLEAIEKGENALQESDRREVLRLLRVGGVRSLLQVY